jgi:acyl-CoA synthetase (AMP-forming)/AMP-acid ligase II
VTPPSTDPGPDLPLTIPSLVRARTETRGDHPLLICDDRVLTYAEAAQSSATLAKGLIAWGAGPGSHVALIYPNGAEFVVAWLAAARIGAVTVPISTFSTSTELHGLLHHADVDTLISTSSYRKHDYTQVLDEAIPELDLTAPSPLLAPSVPALRRLAFDDIGAVPMNTDSIGPGWRLRTVLDAGHAVNDELLLAVEETVRPADRMVIIHTSGSTAEPKGVIHQHGSLIRHLDNLNQVRRYENDEVLFSNAPFFWVGGLGYALLGTLVAGGTLVCSNSPDAADVLDVIERARPTMVNGFAQSVAHLPKDPSFARRDLTSIKRGNLYPLMSPPARPADPELRHNMLGLTETGSVCLASEDESDQPEHRRGSFGRPVAGCEAKVIDPETGHALDAFEVGELCLRGALLMEGYYGRDRAQTFDADGWFHTGDLFQFDGDGFFYFKGRAGDMIKTSGANVSPREVEAAILAETGLQSHVVGVADDNKGQLVAAAIRIPPATTAPDPENLRFRLRSRLSAYKVPQLLLMMDEDAVPMMSSGKLDIRALKVRFREGPADPV